MGEILNFLNGDKDLTEVTLDKRPYCDVCRGKRTSRLALYDAKTWTGRWGYLCEPHFRIETPGVLGLGKGQRIRVRGENPPI